MANIEKRLTDLEAQAGGGAEPCRCDGITDNDVRWGDTGDQTYTCVKCGGAVPEKVAWQLLAEAPLPPGAVPPTQVF